MIIGYYDANGNMYCESCANSLEIKGGKVALESDFPHPVLCHECDRDIFLRDIETGFVSIDREQMVLWTMEVIGSRVFHLDGVLNNSSRGTSYKTVVRQTRDLLKIALRDLVLWHDEGVLPNE